MENKITFSSSVKEEITSIDSYSNERIIALLSAYIRINGVISFSSHKVNVILKSENAKIIKFIYSNLKKLFNDVSISLNYLKKNSRRKKTSYLLLINDAEKLLDDLSVSYLEGKISKEIVYDDETISGYLAGAFLASGSVNSPSTSNYHLEISVVSENYAKWLSRLFSKYHKIELTPKITSRRDKYIIYFKKSDQISNFLIIIGATNSCMEFENQRAYRDFSNNSNRLINLDIANMEKTMNKAQEQINEIKYIDDVLGIHNFHNPKKEMLCYFRMDNESASMSELATMLSKEFGYTITKSNVNHLFRDLHDLYLKLKGRNL